MKHFTQEDIKPSESTLAIIRQVAYSYRAVEHNGVMEMFCLN